MKTNRYEYDIQNRLTSVWEDSPGRAALSERYTYDNNGNKISEQISSYPFTRTSEKQYAYQKGTNLRLEMEADHKGRYTVLPHNALGTKPRLDYDFLTGKVSKISSATKQVTYLYNGAKQRVLKLKKKRERGALVTTDSLLYVHGNHSLPLLEEYIEGTQAVQRIYIYGKDYGAIAMKKEGKNYFFLRDTQGSLRHVVDQERESPVASFGYNTYGAPSHWSISTEEELSSFTYLYAGQEYDRETELYNFRERLYHPRTQMFLQPDPLHQYYSPYTFVGNNPVNHVDRDGKQGKPLLLVDQGIFKERYGTQWYQKLFDDFHVASVKYQEQRFIAKELRIQSEQAFNGHVLLHAHGSWNLSMTFNTPGTSGALVGYSFTGEDVALSLNQFTKDLESLYQIPFNAEAKSLFLHSCNSSMEHFSPYNNILDRSTASDLFGTLVAQDMMPNLKYVYGANGILRANTSKFSVLKQEKYFEKMRLHAPHPIPQQEVDAMRINNSWFSPAYEFGYKPEAIDPYYFTTQPNEDRPMLKIYSRQEYNNLGMRQIGISVENKIAGLKSLF